MGYRRAAVRTHPDKHPPHLRDAAEANFKRLTASHKILLRVGRAIREEAESGDYAGAGAEKRSKLDAEKEEEARRVARLATVFSLNGLSGGFRRVRIHTGPHTAALAWWTPILKDFSRRISPPRVPRFQSRHTSTPFNSSASDAFELHPDVRSYGPSTLSRSAGHLPSEENRRRTRLDLERQLLGLLSRCGEEFKQRARRRRRNRIIRRCLAVALGVGFLFFVRKNAPPESAANEELRAMAESVRAAIRFMGHELATAVGRPQDGEEMADDLELAFLEGRMSVNPDGGLEVLIPDDETPGVYYKLNMSGTPDGSMRVWTEGEGGDQVDVVLGEDDDGVEREPAMGVFGVPVSEMTEGKGSVRFEDDDDDGGGGGGGGAKKGGFFAGRFGGK
jgi:hypothetical protein